MSPTRLGLLGLLALVLILGGAAAGHALATAADVPGWLGRLLGLAAGFSASTYVLRRQYVGG
jgi:hypothetical protein